MRKLLRPHWAHIVYCSCSLHSSHSSSRVLLRKIIVSSATVVHLREPRNEHTTISIELFVSPLLRNVSTKARVALHRYELLTVELCGTLANTNSEATRCAPRTDKAEMSVRLSSTFMLCLETDQHQMVNRDPGGAPPKGDSPTPVSGTVRADGQTIRPADGVLL